MMIDRRSESVVDGFHLMTFTENAQMRVQMLH